MKHLLLIMCALFAITASAKRTYIPRYTTTIAIAMQGADTITVFNHNMEVSITSPDGLFTATVYHDDMTLEKLKTIRRNKASAGWAGFSATLSAFASITSNSFSDRLVNYYNAKAATILSDIYTANAEAANVLGIELVIENPGKTELVVNDMERGLTWFILPHQILTLRLNNPDIAILRIADTQDNRPHYLTVGAGSDMRPLDVVYEGEKYIIYPSYVTNENGSRTIDFYQLIDRRTFEQRSMTKEEYKQFRKENK